MPGDETFVALDVGIVNQEELDRDFALASWTILRWMQSARMRMPWVGTGYAKLSQEAPAANRRLVAMKQWLRARPGALGSVGGKRVSVECSLGPVGKSSVPFRYRLMCDGEEIATGETLMVCVAGTPGAFKSSPVPDRIRAMSAGAAKDASPWALDRVPKEAPAGAFEYNFLVRYSDEDVLKHTNQSQTARFVYDARMHLAMSDHPLAPLAKKPFKELELQYSKESRAGDALSVRLSRCNGGGLSVHIYRGAELLNRGHVDEGADYDASYAPPDTVAKL